MREFADGEKIQTVDFDWEAAFAEEDLDPHDIERFAEAVRDILRWVLQGGNIRLIGVRATALAWTVNPSLFAPDTGDPDQVKRSVSATAVAKHYGMTRAAFSVHCVAAAKAFGVANKQQITHRKAHSHD